MIQLIRGFRDILPEEIELWQHIENTATSLFADFGFKEIRIPIMERTALFARSIGEDTDIVEKEMYTFADRKKGEMLTLRPEATAGIVRSYIQHKLYAANLPQKLYTIGPMFRRERPQKGRFRQFYQINAEVFGVASALLDAQMIFMLMALLDRLDVPDVTAHVNSIGCPDCRPTFKANLIQFLEDKSERLCDDCKRRKDKNPLRVLDCKAAGCQEAIAGAPVITEHLCPACAAHFDTVKRQLDRLKVPYELNSRLVRGLDYYTRTTFEIQPSVQGGQSSIAGGGRYDELVHHLGGPKQPAFGFGIGFDRLASILAEKDKGGYKRPDIFIAALGNAAQETAFGWVCALNETSVAAEMDFENRSLKAQMKMADKLNSSFVLILGEDEIEKGTAILRNMATKAQEEVLLKDAVTLMINKMAAEKAV